MNGELAAIEGEAKCRLTLGNAAGDALLRQVAERISAVIRPDDTVARLGGDEFVIVCNDVSIADIEQIASRALEAIRQPCLLDGVEVSVTASLGIALADDESTPESLLHGSDAAMHLAKERGRGRLEVFDEALRTKFDNRFATQASAASYVVSPAAVSASAADPDANGAGHIQRPSRQPSRALQSGASGRRIRHRGTARHDWRST